MCHSHRLLYIFSTLLLMSLAVACTVPSVPQAPAPPIAPRVLVPTPQPVTAEQFAAAASTAVDTVPDEASQANETTSPLTPAQAELLAGLSSRGAAPELQNEIWFNSEPLKLADLRGNVVIVEFWTYG